MAVTNTGQERYEPTRRPDSPPRKTKKGTKAATGGGGTMESLAGAAAVALAILGLAGVIPTVMAAIASIAIGAALLMEGMAISGAQAQLASETTGSAGKASAGGALSAQTLGGASGIALGILALVGVAPMTLLSVAAIVFGGTLVVGSGARAELDEAIGEAGALSRGVNEASRQAGSSATGGMMLAGLASATLGILALLEVGPQMTLALVAFLVVGGATLLSGSALVSRAATTLRT